MKLVIHSLILALAVTSFAAQAKGSCKKVEKACKAAGHKKKKALNSCVSKVISGESVDGVSVDQASIDSCKKKKGK